MHLKQRLGLGRGVYRGPEGQDKGSFVAAELSIPNYWRSIVVRTLVSAGELSLSCARLLAGWVTTLRLSHRCRSVNMANSSIHPSGVGKRVVIYVIRYTDYGVKT